MEFGNISPEETPLSPLPFLIVTDPATVRLEKPLLHFLMHISATGKSHSSFQNSDEERQSSVGTKFLLN